MSLAGLHDAVTGFAAAIGETLIYGTVLAALTALLVATALRRARPAVLAGVWTVVLLKFAVPVAPALPISFDGIVGAVLSLFRDAEPAVRVVAPARGAVAAAARDSAADPMWLALSLALVVAWAGAVAWLVARRWRAHRGARAAVAMMPAASAALRAAVAEAAAQVGVRAPAVRVGGGAAPYVVGVRHPVAVVPAWLAARGGAELHAALLHEMAHLSRRDVAVRLVQATVGTLFFFWPVVPLINRRIDRAREMACDQWAVARGPLAPPAYARMLLGVARRSCAAALPAGVAGMLGRKKELAHRVDALLAPGRAEPRLSRLGTAALAGWAVVALAGAASASADAAAAPRCEFDPAVAEEFMASYPEADTDRDGVLSHSEACSYQIKLRRLVDDAEAAGWPSSADGDSVRDLSTAESDLEEFGAEICCNCSSRDAPEAAAPALLEPAECTQEN